MGYPGHGLLGSDLLTMCRHAVFVGKEGDGVHCEFMGCSEHSDGNFLSNF